MQTEEHASTDITQDMPDVRAILASIKSIDKQISELTEQRNAIDTQIAELSKQRGEGVEEMAHAREQIDRFLNAAMGIEQPDTGAVASTEPVASPGASAVPAPATSKVAPKYRDPATGQTVVTITNEPAVQHMIWAVFSLFPAAIALLIVFLLRLYPIKK